jgi:hypothetical protein
VLLRARKTYQRSAIIVVVVVVVVVFGQSSIHCESMDRSSLANERFWNGIHGIEYSEMNTGGLSR